MFAVSCAKEVGSSLRSLWVSAQRVQSDGTLVKIDRVIKSIELRRPDGSVSTILYPGAGSLFQNISWPSDKEVTRLRAKEGYVGLIYEVAFKTLPVLYIKFSDLHGYLRVEPEEIPAAKARASAFMKALDMKTFSWTDSNEGMVVGEEDVSLFAHIFCNVNKLPEQVSQPLLDVLCDGR